MKPILIETTSDNTISIQIITPEINGITQPKEVCILMEDEQGDHIVTLAPEQVEQIKNDNHQEYLQRSEKIDTKIA